MPDPGTRGQKAPDPGSATLNFKLMLRRHQKEEKLNLKLF
jgi:hypothetical protein